MNQASIKDMAVKATVSEAIVAHVIWELNRDSSLGPRIMGIDDHRWSAAARPTHGRDSLPSELAIPQMK